MIRFELNEEEEKAARDFINEHKQECEWGYGAQYKHQLPTLGEHYYYKFTPNGLGHSIEIGCCYCNKHKDITDISNW